MAQALPILTCLLCLMVQSDVTPRSEVPRDQDFVGADKHPEVTRVDNHDTDGRAD